MLSSVLAVLTWGYQGRHRDLPGDDAVAPSDERAASTTVLALPV